jgi:hypothetical protein
MSLTFELNAHIPILVWKYLYFIIYFFILIFTHMIFSFFSLQIILCCHKMHTKQNPSMMHNLFIFWYLLLFIYMFSCDVLMK